MYTVRAHDNIRTIVLQRVVDRSVCDINKRILHCNRCPTGRSGDLKIIFLDSFECSPPRKSLVKGERFFRFEREPELLVVSCSVPYIQSARWRRRAVDWCSHNTVIPVSKSWRGLCLSCANFWCIELRRSTEKTYDHRHSASEMPNLTRLNRVR